MFRKVFKIFLALLGVVTGIVLLLLIAVTVVLVTPSVRETVLQKGVAIANEKTDYDIDLDSLYLSPFHHSPMVLYRAYKGEGDLPLEVAIDSLFIGHRGQDTLIYTRTLRLKATAKTSIQDSAFSIQKILNMPIAIDQLQLVSTTFHSDSLIEALGVDVVTKRLALSSPEVVIAEGKYPLHGLRLDDTFVGIDLRETAPDTTAQDTTPLLMAYDVTDGIMRNIYFRLTPLNMDIQAAHLAANVLADVGGNLYDAKRLEVGGFTFDLGSLHLPFDTIFGNACVDLNKNLITSNGLHARSDEIGATADLQATHMDIETLCVNVEGDATYQGSKARLRASYDIEHEAYDATVHIERVNLAPFLGDSIRVVLAGDLEAKGRGIDPKKPLRSHVKLHLDEAQYNEYNLSHTTFEGSTDEETSLDLAMPGLEASIESPMPLFTLIDQILPLVQTVTDSTVMNGLTTLSDLTMLDTIREKIPALNADIALRKGSPIQSIIDSTGVDFNELSVAMRSDSQQTTFHLSPLTFYLTNMRLPAINTALSLLMKEGETQASLQANTRLTDGAMSFYDLCTDAHLQMDLMRTGRDLNATGRLMLDSIVYGNKELGSHAIDMQVVPSQNYANALRADVQLDDIPLEIVESFVTLPDITIEGAVRASASVDGLPKKTDISAEVQPLGVHAKYKPYDVSISLGETPIVMRHNHVDLNGLPIYAADSTYLALSGGLDLDSMRLDITLAADSFAPVKLTQGGPFPVYGELATDLRGTVTGSLDSIIADVDVTILPTTDITYPIDQKNLAQVKPHGTVHARYGVADGALDLGGRLNVDDGVVRYSPKAYPMMPFRVDSGSHVAFNGPLGQTQLHVSASQQVKADVQAEDEETRRVDFTTGVRVNGELDSIGLGSIGFFLEAPNDEAITHELALLDEETREGLAATLLATGMYMGESNEAAQRSGYALSSIINSRINAAMANSKMGKVVDIDISSAKTKHAAGETNDMNISISKSFFKDRLRLTVGSTLTDNPEINTTSGLLSNLSLDYKFTKDRNVMLRLYTQRDYNNILEGELYKSGLAVRAEKEWHRKELFHTDSITRTYGLTADAGIAYRSNNSIGPDLTLKSSVKNLLGKGETFSIKGNGAYYWALRDRHPGDPKKTDTYKLGLNASLIFPYLHWMGENNPEGDTRYMVGYQYENIAGGYGVHKLSGSFTYFIRSPFNPHITHAFTPFSLSVVTVKAESEELFNKAAEYPQLMKVLASDEFVPSIGYNFIYDDYRTKRAVNTFLNLGVKEAGNLINAIYCAFGYKWSDMEKPLGQITFNQFVKLSAELRNKFNLTDKVSIATRIFAGTNIPVGNSLFTPLSEAFYSGGPNSLRASSPYAYGPGNFYSSKYNQSFFHAGDVKLEANFELRFPIVWKLYGAAFVDAGNVWNWLSTADLFRAAGYEDYIERLGLSATLYDGVFNNPEFAKQIALGTGAGLRLDLDGLVIRLDLGYGIHAPYQTYRYDKKFQTDYTQPIRSYYNMPSVLDALRLNFGIGYPF